MGKEQIKKLITEMETKADEYIYIQSKCLSHYMKGYWKGKLDESKLIIEKLKLFIDN